MKKKNPKHIEKVTFLSFFQVFEVIFKGVESHKYVYASCKNNTVLRMLHVKEEDANVSIRSKQTSVSVLSVGLPGA